MNWFGQTRVQPDAFPTSGHVIFRRLLDISAACTGIPALRTGCGCARHRDAFVTLSRVASFGPGSWTVAITIPFAVRAWKNFRMQRQQNRRYFTSAGGSNKTTGYADVSRATTFSYRRETPGPTAPVRALPGLTPQNRPAAHTAHSRTCLSLPATADMCGMSTSLDLPLSGTVTGGWAALHACMPHNCAYSAYYGGT